MDKTTKIDSSSTTIAGPRDDSLHGLLLAKNKQITSLSNDVGKKFPELQYYNADDCAVTSLERNNFKGLHKVKGLFLNDNQINSVEKDSFADMPQMEKLGLGEKT